MFIAEIPRALKHIVLFIPITIACDVLVNFKVSVLQIKDFIDRMFTSVINLFLGVSKKWG